MPLTSLLSVKQLKLDLKNFRTVPQKNEDNAVHAMVSINSDWFWALTESLLMDGYHPTENIIVLKGEGAKQELTVKEGNRRIGALKLIFGYVSRDHLAVPSYIEEKIAGLTDVWKAENASVPCAVYDVSESEVVDRIVALTHGKGEKAGRDKWNPVARARHNRDISYASEPGLDLLEKYLSNGKNLTQQQAERWSGVYPLTVLDEALPRLAARLGAGSARELVDKYPDKVSSRTAVENIIRDIGLEIIRFETIRNRTEDYALDYGIPALVAPTGTVSKASASRIPKGATGSSISSGKSGSGVKGNISVGSKQRAVALDDPRAVSRALKKFTPFGPNRAKLVTLLEEARKLRLDEHPHAFCFLLRSMFEISAKAYCDDHAPTSSLKYVKANGEDRNLLDILRDVTNHLTQNGADKQMKKTLHGALSELGKSEGILSVTSMNQLVHNPKFSIKAPHICVLFGNIFPLLEEMNRQ
jgi:hypothetical protein